MSTDVLAEILPQPTDELVNAFHKAHEQLQSGQSMEVEVAQEIKNVVAGMSRAEVMAQLGTWFLQLKNRLEGKEAELKPIVDHIQSELKYHKDRLDFVKWAITCVLRPGPDSEYVDERVSLFYSPSEKTMINQPEAVPIEFCKVETVPQATLIKEALLQGKEVPGCEVVTNYNLQVKLGGERAIANAKARAKKRAKKIN